jgi:hypothetical protein
MVIMDPYEVEALMRFIGMVSCNGLSIQADTPIGTATSLNFASKRFVMANSFYRDCMIVPKLSIRVAREQRI